MQNIQKFKNINIPFICENCGRNVPALAKGCRNHCPFCLTSKHVDEVNPGDRQSNCHGIMDAISYELGGKTGLVLTFKCRKCQKIIRNIASHEDTNQPDNYDAILALTPKKI